MKENNIPSYTKACIIQYWLHGKTRDEIAQTFETSQGTVSNIIAKFRKKLGNYDSDVLREFGKELRRQNMTAITVRWVPEYPIFSKN